MTKPDNQCRFEIWGKLEEVGGYGAVAGFIAEVEIAGQKYLMVQTPDNGRPGRTRFVGHGGVHAITPLSEEEARRWALKLAWDPMAGVPDTTKGGTS